MASPLSSASINKIIVQGQRRTWPTYQGIKSAQSVSQSVDNGVNLGQVAHSGLILTHLNFLHLVEHWNLWFLLFDFAQFLRREEGLDGGVAFDGAALSTEPPHALIIIFTIHPSITNSNQEEQ